MTGDGRHLLLLGAGHAHVEVLRRFGRTPQPGTRITLLTSRPETPYSGMIPGLIAGHYTKAEAHIDCAALARFAGASLCLDDAIGLDPARRVVMRRAGPPIGYDILSFDIGSTPNTQVQGASDHAIPVKPIAGLLARFETLHAQILATSGRFRITVVGGGAGGVELIFALAHRLRGDLAAGRTRARLDFLLLPGPGGLLPGFPPALVKRITSFCVKRSIGIGPPARIIAVESGTLVPETSAAIQADAILWTTQAAAPLWLRDTGLALDPDGFIAVDAGLAALGYQNIFAAGDIAGFTPRALPKSGVHAVRQGPVLANNLRRLLDHRPLIAHRPQRHTLHLLSTGDRHAIGTRNGLIFSGAWVWHWKDWIDRRFMARYRF